MNCVAQIRAYLNKMIDDVAGMKVLLLDESTKEIVSVVASQRDILAKQVFLVDVIENDDRDKKMQHLRCVVFVRPTSENVRLIINELKDPKYGEYNLFFSNALTKEQLSLIAIADENELIRQVQEFFADYIAVNRNCFSLNVKSIAPIIHPNWNQQLFDRIREGIVSCLLSFKKRPIIRYQRTSELAKHAAQDIGSFVDQESQLFDFRTTQPLLLIMERSNDPVTPLLTQWTYQAMIHELLGIHQGRVNLKNVNPQIKKDLEEVVVSPEEDAFFNENMYSNYGELCLNIKSLVDTYQQRASLQQNISTIEDMSRFVEKVPEFAAFAGSVSKHVSLVSEMNHIIDARALLTCSQVEQDLACNDSHSDAQENLRRLIADTRVQAGDALRAVILYALRYQRDSKNKLDVFVDMLRQKGVSGAELKIIREVLEYAGSGVHDPELFGEKSLTQFMKKAIRGLNDVSNVYTQHEPLIKRLLEGATKGKLKETTYPYYSAAPRDFKPTEIIVFIIGGCTFEEALFVSNFTKANTGVKALVGGTTLLNSEGFLSYVKKIGNPDDVFEARASTSRKGKRRVEMVA